MTNKSYTNKVYYSFIKSYYQHDITVTCSNVEKVRRDYGTKGIAFNGYATRSTEILNVDPHNFCVSALHMTDQSDQVTLQSKFSN